MQHNQHQQPQSRHQLSEGLEAGDLAHLVDASFTIDEYKSKMGSDEDVCVLTFKVQGKDPARDLVSFIEKSYDWVLDADASSGELDDGTYLVFVEIDREADMIENIMLMLGDLEKLTDIAPADWRAVSTKPKQSTEPSVESLANIIPTSPSEYRNLRRQMTDDIDKLKLAAGVKVNTTAPNNEYTESLRRAAGIR